MTVTQPAATLRQLFAGHECLSSQEILSGKGLELAYNGRTALLRACHALSGARTGTKVLVPAYHCPACVTPILQAGLQPVYYRITRDLVVDWEDLLAKLDVGVAAVMIIHFFGIETDFGALEAHRRNGLAIIEDWSHSFLRDNPLRLAGGDSDFRIYSFWKSLPLQAGGALVRSAAWKDIAMTCRPKRLPLGNEIRFAKRLFEEALQNSDREWAKVIFTLIESLRLRLKGASPPTPAVGNTAGNSGALVPRQDIYSMPWVAERVMRRTELVEVLRTRQAHYARYIRLFDDLAGVRLPFPEPGTSACPWLFPMIIDNREAFSAYCRQHAGLVPQTFGSDLHDSLLRDMDSRMVGDATYLADHVVCLPIHQDLTTNEIEATGRKLLEYFKLEAEKSAWPL